MSATKRPFSPLPNIHCSGSPHEIGHQHGLAARSRVHGTISFYAAQLKSAYQISWPAAQKIAMKFEPFLREKYPEYVAEMTGIAEGANVTLSDIITINVRTDITFSMFEGCTALAWKGAEFDYLAQNFDWMEVTKANLIRLTIVQSGKPTIKTVTEAGLIGKIGINSAGVGVCLNAIQAKGHSFTRMPIHIALRIALESTSQPEAVAKIEEKGVAASVHILVADAKNGAVGLECTHVDVKKLRAVDGRIEHANHFLLDHAVEDTKFRDSICRVDRIGELTRELALGKRDPTLEDVFELFKYEEGLPGAICRNSIEDGAGWMLR